jgi:DNA-binding transcriptional regulator YiaG
VSAATVLVDVPEWNGRLATALRESLRMTMEEFAERLNMSHRAVAYWSARPDTILSKATQRFLDTLLEHSPAAAQSRFAKLAGLTPEASRVAVIEPYASHAAALARRAELEAQSVAIHAELARLDVVLGTPRLRVVS